MKEVQPAAAFSAADRERGLARTKLGATALLVAAALLFVLARHQGAQGGWAWVGAFAEAAMVGALADWFAVVALFRHPLGVPIPHTAILPRNKARVAQNLADFVRDKFLDPDALVARLRGVDPAALLARWLEEPKNAELLAARIAGVIRELVTGIDDERVRGLVVEALSKRAERFDLGEAVGTILDGLTRDGRHQALLDEILVKLAEWLDDPEVQQSLAGMIVEVAGNEYPKLVAMLGIVGVDTGELGAKMAASLVAGIDRWLHDIGEHPDHPRRIAFDDTVATFIGRLKHDPEFRARIDGVKRGFLAHPALREYLGELWAELRTAFTDDLAREDSKVRGKLAAAAGAFARSLGDSPALRESLNDHLETAVRALAPRLRDGIAGHIVATVRAWDDRDLVREIEFSVGRDLQFIRVNGTLVGGLIGVAIHAAGRLIPGL